MCRYESFSISLDRRERGTGIDFISHAHSDHTAAAKSTKRAILSAATAGLIKAAYGIDMDGRQLNAVRGVKLLSAGHVLGSRQLVVENGADNGKTIYSGDFQMDGSRAAERIEVENADTLIVDSTYPQRGLRFEDRSEAEEKITRWAKEQLKSGIVLFKAYPIGKAQELIRILNEEGICPVVSKKISAVNAAYKKYGMDLQYTSAFDGVDHEPAIRGTFVGITEKGVDSLKPVLMRVHGKKVFTAVATGFAKLYKFNTDAQFVLSDHADSKQRLEYIDGVSPKRIFTYGKDAVELASNLSREGYPASAYGGKAVSCRLMVEEEDFVQQISKNRPT